MKKILNIIPTLRFGGGPMTLLTLITADRDNCHLVVSDKGDDELFEKFERASGGVFNLDVLHVSVASVLGVVRICRRERPDIIHAHGKGGAFYALMAAVLLYKPCPIIYTFHGFNNRFSGFSKFAYICFERLFSLFVDRYVAVSDSERKKVLAAGVVSRKRVLVVPNGVEISKKEMSTGQLARLSNGKTNIVTLSRLSPQKDLLTMLEAFAYLVKERSDVALHVIGGTIPLEAAYADEVRGRCRQLQLEKNVIFWGDLPFAGDYLHYFDIYWSTALWEGLPTAVIESMMQEVPVVATNVMGNLDLVCEGKTGYLTPPEEPAEIARILRGVLDNPNKSIIRNAREFACANFSRDAYVEKIAAVYKVVST